MEGPQCGGSEGLSPQPPVCPCLARPQGAAMLIATVPAWGEGRGHHSWRQGSELGWRRPAEKAREHPTLLPKRQHGSFLPFSRIAGVQGPRARRQHLRPCRSGGSVAPHARCCESCGVVPAPRVTSQPCGHVPPNVTPCAGGSGRGRSSGSRCCRQGFLLPTWQRGS